jgi:hypothetical protein
MQDFHADCTINLLVTSRGSPAKHVWSCSLTDRNRVPLVLARRFVGIASRDQVEWRALLFGLSQAHRLQQEKVALCADFTVAPGQPGKLRDAALQSMKEQVDELWARFRLHKVEKFFPAERDLLRDWAEEAFARKGKGER